MGSNPHQCLWTHDMQVLGLKRISYHADLCRVSRCCTRGESEDHTGEKACKGSTLTLKTQGKCHLKSKMFRGIHASKKDLASGTKVGSKLESRSTPRAPPPPPPGIWVLGKFGLRTKVGPSWKLGQQLPHPTPTEETSSANLGWTKVLTTFFSCQWVITDSLLWGDEPAFLLILMWAAVQICPVSRPCLVIIEFFSVQIGQVGFTEYEH